MTNQDWSELGVVPNSDGEIETTCLSCGGPAVLWRGGEDELKAHCIKCKKLDAAQVVDALRAAFKARQSSPDSQPKPTSKVFASKPLAVANGHANGHSVARLEDDPKQALLSWQLELTYGIKQALAKPTIKNWLETDPAGLRANMVDSFKANGIPPALQTLSPAVIEDAIFEVVSAYIPLPAAPEELIVSENYESAIAANDLYMSRKEIVERLFYAQSISLAVGGKHHGKSTAVRTLAMSISRGVKFLDRQCAQGHVIYAASAEEVPVARMELLNMGWQQNQDLLTLIYANPDADDPVDERNRVLDEVAKLAARHGTVFIVLDMLFDFARIRDEMSYAGTRQAIGKVQMLADITKAHVLATHHSPKYMLDTASAATAALGSQGIAARFSPIVLSRSWGEGLYTIESTMTRDPRGEALSQTVVTRDENGWIQSGGEFKERMKWRLYRQRVLDWMEAGEKDQKFTAAGIAKDLAIDRAHIQNTLKEMADRGELQREKHGRGYRYWIVSTEAEEP